MQSCQLVQSEVQHTATVLYGTPTISIGNPSALMSSNEQNPKLWVAVQSTRAMTQSSPLVETGM